MCKIVTVKQGDINAKRFNFTSVYVLILIFVNIRVDEQFHLNNDLIIKFLEIFTQKYTHFETHHSSKIHSFYFQRLIMISIKD